MTGRFARVVVVAVLLAAAAVALPLAAPARAASGSGAPTVPGPLICGQAVLDSPWNYTGGATTFTSGQYAGLPTFGSAGTNFPSQTSGIIVPAGNNTAAAMAGTYKLNGYVVYFAPGMHDIEATMNSGHDSVYVGGYTSGLGSAVLNGVDGATEGTGHGGDTFTQSTTENSNSNVINDTWEYLTVENFTTFNNNTEILGETTGITGNTAGGISEGNTYKYDTIGPNLYGYTSASTPPAYGQNSGAGYAFTGGTSTTLEYDCITQDGQGGVNFGAGVGITIANNEFSYQGLGIYPDEGGTGASTFSCGCSGGVGKLFFTLNADVVNNYVHDNYVDAGIWFDSDNAGEIISHNYVIDTWGEGIMDEMGYNTDISDNTLIGNGWNYAGIFPPGNFGGSCTSSDLPCQNGFGYLIGVGGGFPYSAIYIPNTGGSTGISTVNMPSWSKLPSCPAGSCPPQASRNSNKVTVEGNVLTNNFGGTMVYSDTGRFAGNLDTDNNCTEPDGPLNQQNNSLYYQQSYQLINMAGDAAISGNAVTTASGMGTECQDYGNHGYFGGVLTGFNQGAATGGYGSVTTAPVVGMVAYNVATGTYLGTVASVTSANSFTLSGSPGNATGVVIALSDLGGCGFQDMQPPTGGPGTISGTPAEPYWDNCLFGSKNVTVKNNVFSTDASAVANCTDGAALCGFNSLVAWQPGTWYAEGVFGNWYQYVAKASGGLGNVFAGNTYTWTGGGAGAWQFWAGDQGNTVGQSAWQASPYGQDAGSTFG